MKLLKPIEKWPCLIDSKSYFCPWLLIKIKLQAIYEENQNNPYFSSSSNTF